MAKTIIDHIESAAALLKIEFAGKTPDEIYQLAFARLLLQDPRALLGQTGSDIPLMIGTDERDQFVPVLLHLIENLCKKNGAPLNVLDIGGGDGQTMGLLLPAFSNGTTISVVEPNKPYIENYFRMLAARTCIKMGRQHAMTFDQFLSTHAGNPASHDLILMIHSIYFASDMKALTGFLSSSLKPGGKAVIVFADEDTGYTGTMCKTVFDAHAPHEAQEFRRRVHERHDLLDTSAGLGELVLEYVHRQDTGLFAHSLKDMLALAFITALPFATDIPIEERIDTVAAKLIEILGAGELSLGSPPPRRNMFRGSEPQIIAVISKPSPLTLA